MRDLVRVIGASLAAALVACGHDTTAATRQPVALHLRPAGTDGPFALNVGAAVPLEARRD